MARFEISIVEIKKDLKENTSRFDEFKDESFTFRSDVRVALAEIKRNGKVDLTKY